MPIFVPGKDLDDRHPLPVIVCRETATERDTAVEVRRASPRMVPILRDQPILRRAKAIRVSSDKSRKKKRTGDKVEFGQSRWKSALYCAGNSYFDAKTTASSFSPIRFQASRIRSWVTENLEIIRH
jgi:hypothetical protein